MKDANERSAGATDFNDPVEAIKFYMANTISNRGIWCRLSEAGPRSPRFSPALDLLRCPWPGPCTSIWAYRRKSC